MLPSLRAMLLDVLNQVESGRTTELASVRVLRRGSFGEFQQGRHYDGICQEGGHRGEGGDLAEVRTALHIRHEVAQEAC